MGILGEKCILILEVLSISLDSSGVVCFYFSLLQAAFVTST